MQTHETGSFTVEVLDPLTDTEKWLHRWQHSGREPFAHPSFCRHFAGSGERAAGLVVESELGFALIPLIIRRVHTGNSGQDLYDATSPYGYGGPFLSGALAPGAALDGLEDWAARQGLCSVFLRLSLGLDLMPGTRTGRSRVVRSADNVVVDLRRTEAQLWDTYDRKVRKNVRKAVREGCSVRRDERLEDVGSFLDVYWSTMQRRGAAQWYHFDKRFFDSFLETMAGCYSVFSVVDQGGRVVSVELVLESDRYLYSFLGGTLADAFPLAPNDLLKHEVIRHGRRTGREGFVLGGGYQPGDGIFRYKRAFAPDGVRGFLTARIIGDAERYSQLVPGPERLPPHMSHADFFPAYRRPGLRPAPAAL